MAMIANTGCGPRRSGGKTEARTCFSGYQYKIETGDQTEIKESDGRLKVLKNGVYPYQAISFKNFKLVMGTRWVSFWMQL